MGRIKQNIEVNNKLYWALFDSGARNTYVIEKVVKGIPIVELIAPNPVTLGGRTHQVSKVCTFNLKIQNLPMVVHARILDEIGVDEDGKSIEMIMGALTMQEWGIRLIPETENIDLTHYPKEFIEF